MAKNDIRPYEKGDFDDFGQFGLAAAYLRASQYGATDIPDVFANYFCDGVEVARAQIKAENPKYFAVLAGEGNTVIKSGYGKFIGSKKQDLIELATAFYFYTDEEGVVHRDESELLAVPDDELLAEPREMDHAQRASVDEVQQEVPVRHGVE